MEHVDVIQPFRPIPDSRGVRSRDWKYIRYVNTDPEVEQLYHLKTDPHEAKDLSKDSRHAEDLKRMRKRYEHYRKKLQS